MRSTLCLTAALALCAYGTTANALTAGSSTPDADSMAQASPAGDEAAPAPSASPDAAAAPVADANAAPAPAAAAAAAPAAFQLNGTTWTFVDPKEGKVKESIDANGNYIAQTVAGKHLDHGTSVMKDGKACFTSAMTKEGEICWTTKPVDVGQSIDTVSDKGEKLTVTRVDYVPLKMPH